MQDRIDIPLSTSALDMYLKCGVIEDASAVPQHLNLYVKQSEQVLEEVRKMVAKGELPVERGIEFQQLLIDITTRVMCHPIVASNNYLKRFAEGVTKEQAAHELKQFSVFALQFDIAQAKLVANAPTEEAYHERLNVLLNEKGIPYQDGFEGELTGKWSPDTVHFSWLLRTAAGLDLKFDELGKIWIGLPGTKAFVNVTFENYASVDQNTALGASFGIENWAANYLWTPWIAGMKKYNETADKKVHLGYLTYHESEEAHHSQATLDELLEHFLEPWFDAEKFFEGADNVLTDGVQKYYESQLETLPGKEGGNWPISATDPRTFDPAEIPRLATSTVAT